MTTHKNGGLIHQFDTAETGIPLPVFFAITAGVVLVGVVFGFAVAKIRGGGGTNVSSGMSIKTNKAEGIADKKTFKDQAEGVLKEGGIDGEGNFHLERPGGVSQNVYLTSTTVDLSQYVNKKVRVHGETFNAQKAGWLMDVGLVEIL